MKRTITKILITVVLILVIPVSLVLTGFCLPSQFGDSFYGEIAEVYHELKETERKKIIFIGNSAVAFGVRKDLVESEIPAYKSINFGVYGAVGTKYMLDLSKANIGNGDVIVIMPELYQQTCSLYFSARDVWRAADSDYGMLSYVAKENKESIVGNFFGYTAEKYKYFTGNGDSTAEGAYTKAAFTDKKGNYVGYMTYERPYNTMSGGYDPANLPVLNESVFGAGFIDYLNAYNAYAKGKGATVYFGFAPINELAVGDNAYGDGNALYNYLREHLDFEVIGHPIKYLMDYRWFYDNNVHMNSYGAITYTDILVEDLKLALDIEEPNNIDLPDPPEIPEKASASGDNSDAQYFNYEIKEGATGKYVFITGLTEEGKTRASLTLPTDYDGIPVREFAAETFRNNAVISRIVLPQNISVIYEDSFLGATRLSALYFEHDSILDISVTEEFLRGADNCYIYLKSSVNISAGCTGGWEFYGKRIRTY